MAESYRLTRLAGYIQKFSEASQQQWRRAARRFLLDQLGIAGVLTLATVAVYALAATLRESDGEYVGFMGYFTQGLSHWMTKTIPGIYALLAVINNLPHAAQGVLFNYMSHTAKKGTEYVTYKSKRREASETELMKRRGRTVGAAAGALSVHFSWEVGKHIGSFLRDRDGAYLSQTCSLAAKGAQANETGAFPEDLLTLKKIKLR
jgi:hypothetical protein